MPANLDTVPTGSNLLIDANIFVYGLTNASAQCQTLLARCSSEEVYGITLFEVIHEAAHRFMIGEARAKGLFTATEKGAKYLANHPEEVKLLTAYWVNTQRLLALNLVYLPMEEKIVKEAQPERVNAGLLTNDSIIVAAMKEYGISQIATNDGGFDAVAGISVFSPMDI
jgi:predicted nucleic acid-binding protein